jgi:hypothetical protein
MSGLHPEFKGTATMVKNPMYGTPMPKAVRASPKLRKLWSRKEMRISVAAAEILPLQARLRPILKRAWPSGGEKNVSWLTADLAGLWEVSRVHIMLIEKLLQQGNKLNKDELKGISIDLEINWSSNAPGHIQTLKRGLSRFRSSLYEQTNRRRRA